MSRTAAKSLVYPPLGQTIAQSCGLTRTTLPGSNRLAQESACSYWEYVLCCHVLIRALSNQQNLDSHPVRRAGILCRARAVRIRAYRPIALYEMTQDHERQGKEFWRIPLRPTQKPNRNNALGSNPATVGSRVRVRVQFPVRGSPVRFHFECLREISRWSC